MKGLFVFASALAQHPDVQWWNSEHTDELGKIAQHWFAVMHACGGDVRELLHDGYPTACIGNVAFAYVGAFKAHVNVGFFRGAELPDPGGLLEGSGKMMRHVKLRPAKPIDEGALTELVRAAYDDMKQRIE